MILRISNCGHDENGKYRNGKPGDQTAKEWELVKWNGFYKVVLRHPDNHIARLIELQAIAAAMNDHIGYDQNNRLTFWEALQKANYYVSCVTDMCECDCSSGVAAIVKSVGFLENDHELRNISTSLTTRNMESALRFAGFDVIKESNFLLSDRYLMYGDILLNPGHHVAIAVACDDITSGETKTKKPVSARFKNSSYKGKYVCESEINLEVGDGKSSPIRKIAAGSTLMCYGYYNIVNNNIMLYVQNGPVTGYVNNADVIRYEKF